MSRGGGACACGIYYQAGVIKYTCSYLLVLEPLYEVRGEFVELVRQVSDAQQHICLLGYVHESSEREAHQVETHDIDEHKSWRERKQTKKNNAENAQKANNFG